ncbi:Iwr1p SCDLUD_002714 [Saccharomycodes ludwigii]|uniref:Iwr1p n=1 Tax=Saccharomycodes ludwigii TaxID=36035 RepID=UPI001E836830|nr:hypothetical protein SCDLUD_002714 [Saccharomycodes ludwigii]KAH3901228.1 hypothetical protein SCDLUD_002714 [Saccharomycodes ludwigii]
MNKNVASPSVIRIKRRRDEDSLQALLLETARNSKRGKYVFKLSKTVDTKNDASHLHNNNKYSLNSYTDTDNNPSYRETPVLESTSAAHTYILAKSRLQEIATTSTKLKPEVNELLQEYLQTNENVASTATSDTLCNNMLSIEYVYDIYVKQKISQEDDFLFDKNTMGYVRIMEDDLIPDEESDLEERQILSDDEDSNTEDFYRNDYPEDEDDDRSIVFGDHEEKVAEETNFFRYGHDHELEIANNNGSIGISYDRIYDQYNNSSNNGQGSFLDSIRFNRGANGYEDDRGSEGKVDNLYDESSYNTDYEYDGEEEEDSSKIDFPRNQFFATDRDDPLAIHRDKIMNKLQKIIDKSK